MKITKAETKNHQAAEEILNQVSTISHPDREFVYRHWHPGANHLQGVNSAFFTPWNLAKALILGVRFQDDVVIDLAAGHGMLMYQYYRTICYDILRKQPRMICVELNPEYVKIGQKLLPEAEWIRGDIFQAQTWESLGLPDNADILANPPYQTFKKAEYPSGERWLSYYGRGSLMAAEVALRLSTRGGAMILPQATVLPFQFSGIEFSKDVEMYRRADQCRPYVTWQRAIGYHTIEDEVCFPQIDQLYSVDTTFEEVPNFWGASPVTELCNIEWMLAHSDTTFLEEFDDECSLSRVWAGVGHRSDFTGAMSGMSGESREPVQTAFWS